MKKTFITLAILFIGLSVECQYWQLIGNSGTNPKVNFIGTTDNRSLYFRINNKPAGILDSAARQTFFGYGAGNNSGTDNVAIGWKSMTGNSSGYDCTAVGSMSLMNNTSGWMNTALGYAALNNNTTGISNVAAGNTALLNNTTGNENSAFGTSALVNSNGEANTAAGWGALYSNGTGQENTADGHRSNQSNAGGNYNTSVGASSLYQNFGAWYNTCVGYRAGYSYQLGWNNVILGANCDVTAAGRYNVIAIGQAVTCTNNSQARIGNAATSSIGGYASWTNISDGRYKKDINENVKGLDFIMKLKPVTYHLDITGISKKLNESRGKEYDQYMIKAIKDKEKILYSGFIAQEVEQAAKDAGYDFSGVDKPGDENDLYGLRYAEFVVPIVKGMQEQQEMLQEQKDLINQLIKQNSDLLARVNELEKKQANYGSATESLSVYPNPSDGKLFISLAASQPSTAILTITDGKGSLVKKEQLKIKGGINQLSMDIKSLSNGIYYLSAEWNNGQIRKSAQIAKQ